MNKVSLHIGKKNGVWRIFRGTEWKYGPFRSERAAFDFAKDRELEIDHGVRRKPKLNAAQKSLMLAHGKKKARLHRIDVANRFKETFPLARTVSHKLHKKKSDVLHTPFFIRCRARKSIDLRKEFEAVRQHANNGIPTLIAKADDDQEFVVMELKDFLGTMQLLHQLSVDEAIRLYAQVKADLLCDEESNEPLDENERPA